MSSLPFNAVVDLVDVYWDEPGAFFEDILGFIPDEWQQNVLNDLAHNPWVAVRSGQGVGKTALEAATVIWYLCTRPNPKVVCTAPTRQQLNDVLWAEVAKWLETSMVKKLLKWTKTKVYMMGHEQRWFATARTATKPENMQGFHEDYMLFICDEASGIEDNIMEAILGTLSGPENKLLMCGNPTKTSGLFYDAFHKDRSNYKTHKVSSYDSSRASFENIQRLIIKYGEDSDVVRIRVHGEFPKSEPDTFIPLEIVELAAETKLDAPDHKIADLGVDVARFGDDETVISPKVGEKVFSLLSYRGKDTTETTGYVLDAARNLMKKHPQVEQVYIKVDDSGVGGGVTDQLQEFVKQKRLPYKIFPVINNGKADDEEHYDNVGTESWAAVRDILKENFSGYMQGKELSVQLPKDEKLISQLTTRKYRMTSKGKLTLERKEDMKKRGLLSPDRADAVVLAFYRPKVKKAGSWGR